MKIFLERQNQKISRKFNGKALDLIKQLRLNPEEILIVKNSSLVTEDEPLSDSDEVKILSVISGG
ncbi:MAG: hypothetical protein QS98_C0005G0060 [archaeon GW2011_AR3]|nr:MAG: hypothetical protein QS98_C0005G0060 [archaeon GW2011_AR3]MBS3109435.1 MoaD/ThiS family protein [Candidatus Woesearchaeota archaeon]